MVQNAQSAYNFTLYEAIFSRYAKLFFTHYTKLLFHTTRNYICSLTGQHVQTPEAANS